MYYLIFAILFSTFIFVIFKFFEKFKIDSFQAIAVNYLVAATIGYLSYDKPFTVKDILAADWFAIDIATGYGFVISFFLYAVSSKKIGIAITAVSSKMSVIIPSVAGFLLFKEDIDAAKIVGIILTLVALFLILKNEPEKKKQKKVKENAILLFFLPVVIFFLTGINDVLMNYTEEHFINNDLILMISTIFLFAFGWSFSMLCIAVASKKSKFAFKNILAGIILGVTNFALTVCLFNSMEAFDSSIMFPILNIGVVGLSALIGLFFFKEKLRKINYFGIGLAIIAIFIITYYA